MGIKEMLSELKYKILADVISAVSIMDVLERNPDENNIKLYITTNNIETVNSDVLAVICSKYTTPQIFVSFLVPTFIVTSNGRIPNTYSVCLFIEKWN